MIVMLPIAAGFVIGLFLGWLLTKTYAVAAISRSQERMQRKVRYWQAEAARFRHEAARLARLLAARDVWPKPTHREEWR